MEGEEMEREGRTYQRQLEHDLPDPEIVQTSLPADLSEKHLETTFLAKLRLNVEVTLLFPAIHEMNDVIGLTELLKHLDLLQLPATVSRASIGVSRSLDGVDSIDREGLHRRACGGNAVEARGRGGDGMYRFGDTIDLGEFPRADQLDLVESRRQTGVDLRAGKATDGRDARAAPVMQCEGVSDGGRRGRRQHRRAAAARWSVVGRSSGRVLT